jgi:hypothetical protein
VSDRIDQLEMRRRQLLLRSEGLRADLAADQRVIEDAISGIDRMVGKVRSLAMPVLLAGAGALFFAVLRRRIRPVGFAMRGLMWISLARRLLAVFTLVRAATRSRGRSPELESQP